MEPDRVDKRTEIVMTHQIATIVGIIGFLICIATALVLALGSRSKKKRDA